MDITSILNKVSGCLATAESFDAQGNKEAAATYRAKADSLMAKYRIEEEQLIAQDATAALPTNEAWDIYTTGARFARYYNGIIRYIAEHTGIRVKIVWPGAGHDHYVLLAVGYAADIRYAHLLWNASFQAFQERLEPQVNPALSEAENIYRLRSSGMARIVVSQLLYGTEEGLKPSKCARLAQIYKAECAKRGEAPALDGKGIDLTQFRKTFAESFVSKLGDRLYMARQAAGEMGGGITLHGRQERVDEAFYTLFPDMRPRTAVAPLEGGASSQEVAEVEKPCAKCAKASSGYCREHKPWTPTAADRARWDRETNGAAARAGRAAGHAAAQEVELAGVKRAKRLDS